MQSALRSAAEFVELALQAKPELIIHASDFPAAAAALRDVLAKSDRLFDRGVPVRFVRSIDGGPAAVPLTKNYVVIEAHKVCRPIKVSRNGEHIPVTLPDRIAQMYLDMSGEWDLKPLAGFTCPRCFPRTAAFVRPLGTIARRACGVTLFPILLFQNDQADRMPKRAFVWFGRRSKHSRFPDRLFDSLAGVEVTDINRNSGQR